MIQAHADAILDLLRADPDLNVHDGHVPDGSEPPYVLVYIADSDPEQSNSHSLTAESERHVMWAYCHCVGANQIAARAVAQRVRAALLDVTPTIPGRVCWPIRREEGQPADRDESTGQVVVDLVDVYRLESVPA
ncbi:MAG: hypothetical protein IRZ05_20185 [Micromonosporaceae bacterium]|nr:hypothetical protein [Micromonosporaceae bacterium]